MTKGQRIKSKREELAMSQTELANRIGISKQLLYKYEKGLITNIPSDSIEKLSDALNVSPAYILGWEIPGDASNLVKSIESLPPEKLDALKTYLKFLLSDS